jgi:hypothetical protein
MNPYINELLLICLLSIPFLSADSSPLDNVFEKAHTRCRINPGKSTDGSNGTCMEALSKLRLALQERKKNSAFDANDAKKLQALESDIHAEYVDAKKTNPFTSKNSRILKALSWITFSVLGSSVARMGDNMSKECVQIDWEPQLKVQFKDPNFGALKDIPVPVIMGGVYLLVSRSLEQKTEEMRLAHQEIKDIKTEYYGFTNPFNDSRF